MLKMAPTEVIVLRLGLNCLTLLMNMIVDIRLINNNNEAVSKDNDTGSTMLNSLTAVYKILS